MSAPERLVIASANPDKAAEMREILAAVVPGIVALDRPAEVPDVEETGTTFEENARLKAVALVEATGEAAIADDSGLEVDALGGAPGVYSARYAGEDATYEDNVVKLLGALHGATTRRARFVSVVVVRLPDGREIVAEGAVGGVIADAPFGEHGFGYDPVFVPDGGGGRSFSELTPAEKHALSHRGIAMRRAAEALARW
jgi:XTP/dITP diphosphohydrolase